MDSEQKTCSRCGVTKSVYDFYIVVERGKYVSQRWCKECMRQYKSDWYKRRRAGSKSGSRLSG